MSKRFLAVAFFVVVFGLPVGWYLFLQLYGENKFDLPKLGEWDSTCLEVSKPTLISKGDAFQMYPNQLKRIQEAIKLQGVISLHNVDSCDLRFEAYLVDAEGQIRGEYDIGREEVDRLLAEMDILILNERDESGN